MKRIHLLLVHLLFVGCVLLILSAKTNPRQDKDKTKTHKISVRPKEISWLDAMIS